MDTAQHTSQIQEATKELNSFIDELIDKKLEEQKQTLEPKDREEVRKILLNEFSIFLLESIYEELPEEQQTTFKQLIEEKKSIEELHQFATEHITDYNDFIVDVMLDFEDAYLAGELDETNAPAAFINDLIDQKGFTNLSQEQRAEIAQDIAKRLDEFIMAQTLAQFSEEEITEFKKMLDEKKSRAELQQYAMAHVPDYQTFLSNALIEFQAAYLSQ